MQQRALLHGGGCWFIAQQRAKLHRGIQCRLNCFKLHDKKESE